MFCCLGRVTNPYSLCFGGWLAARCGKQLGKAENCLLCKVSERTLDIFAGLFCYLLGTKLACVLLFWKRHEGI